MVDRESFSMPTEPRAAKEFNICSGGAQLKPGGGHYRGEEYVCMCMYVCVCVRVCVCVDYTATHAAFNRHIVSLSPC